MKFITMIVIIALSNVAVCSQDFGDHAIFEKTASTNSVRSQSDSSTYLPIFTTEQSPENSQTFQEEIKSQRPSLHLTPPKISYSACEPSSKPDSKSSSQYSSMCMSQSFRDSTSYNPRLNQRSYSSILSPLNVSESSTHLSPQPLFSSTAKPLRLVPFRTKQWNGYTSGNEAISFEYSGRVFPSEMETIIPREQTDRDTVNINDNVGGYFSHSLFPSTSTRSLRLVSKRDPSLGRGVGGADSPIRTPPPYTPPSSPYAGFEGGGFEESNYTYYTTPIFTTPFAGTEGVTDIYSGKPIGYDFEHPPHIHSLDVECSKTMMTINIEFNRAFDGVIYSKGYYTNPECMYVTQNSGLTRYSFTVNLDSCGTQFINDFEGATGQAYLENVLVLQNEPNIQEVWDTVRRIRCVWEGNVNKALTVNLSIDMLNQEIVTFSGDTATAVLDIQIGKGPFAPAADGLVKIGETMTLVVFVEGDPGFDLQVRDCLARDEASINMLQLTDERGCILKPKLFGAFQKTNNTGNTGASIIAYAFFQAFKFPDVMDLYIECNVELCKTNCEPCPEANQQIEPGRRRRSITYASFTSNSTNSVLLLDPIRVGRRFKVIMLNDLSTASTHILDGMKETAVKAITNTKRICMSNNRFYTILSLILGTLFIAVINAVVLYVKLQRIRKSELVDFKISKII